MESDPASLSNHIEDPQDVLGKQAMLAAIIDSSDDAIISKSLDGIIRSWNPAAERIFGYNEAEILGRHISVLIPNDLRQEEGYIISEIAKGNKIDHFRTRRLTKDGRIFPVSLKISPIRNSMGVITGASKILRDITDQQLAEEKQFLLASIIDSSGDAIISKNLQGFITSWNKGAERIFGYKQDEMLGKHITLLISPAYRQEEEYIISRIIQGDKIDHFQTVRLGKAGNEIPVSITVSPIKNKDGSIIGASKIARDVQQQVTQTQRLQELNRSKDEFIGIASHELKTPLTSIKAYAQVLERKLTEDQNYPFVTRMLQQVEKLSTLISDLLDVSKIQAGRMQFNFEPFDFNNLILEVIDTIRHTATQAVIYKPSATPIAVTADRQRIEQVLINLLSNAIKYSPQSDKVIVECNQNSDEIRVNVQDFGIGVPPSDLDKIFSRFYRAEGLAPSFSGLGIGLYISNEIILRHKGRLFVESELGKGSVFSFNIPSVQHS